MEITRKLASVRRISALQPIEGADKIECAIVDGWTVVVKKGEFNPGDLCVYLEIDSWVPHTVAPFLTKPGHVPKEFNGIQGQRLKTIKLKGQLSQGLVLPYSFDGSHQENDDVTEVLGIQKWEKPLAACLAGVARGNFPSAIPKTDQERIQNLGRSLEKWITEEDGVWEVTEKLDGSSCTFYLDKEGVFHVCSRNLDLVRTEANAFWKMAIDLNIEEKMRGAELEGVAIQGELLGWNIQGNNYGLNEGEYRFYVFDMYETYSNTYSPFDIRLDIANVFGLDHSPVVHVGRLPENSVQNLLTMAEGPSMINPSAEREGLVFKNQRDTSVSFKAISNKWLLANE